MPSTPIRVSVNPQQQYPGVYLNASGNRARIQLQQSVKVGANASLSLTSATCVYNFPNVHDDTIQLELSEDNGAVWAPLFDDNDGTITIPQGLYDTAGFTATLSELWRPYQEEIKVNTGDDSDVGPITFTPNFATERIVLTPNLPTFLAGATNQIRVKMSANVAKITGFTQVTVISNSSTLTAPAVAHFNQVNALRVFTSLLQSDQQSRGVVNGALSDRLLEIIPLDARPGHQVIYQAPYKQSFSTSVKEFADFEVGFLDEEGRDIKMNSSWSINLTLEYD